MYRDLGSKYAGVDVGDASAAHRKGFGKLGHLSADFRWVQEKAAKMEPICRNVEWF